jgi:hypothetical protein
MNRLTTRDKIVGLLINEEERMLISKGYVTNDEMYKVTQHLAEKLAEYEDLEEQGLLLKLPCKIGDTIYRPIPKTYKRYSVMKIKKIIVKEDGIFFTTDKLQSLYFNISKIGKTMFLTKEEAEQFMKKESEEK